MMIGIFSRVKILPTSIPLMSGRELIALGEYVTVYKINTTTKSGSK